MRTQVSLTIDEKLLDWVDCERTNMPRSKFINKILRKEYDEFKQSFDWEEENKISEEQVYEGKTKQFKNAKEALKWLKS
jgi:metal-responsive CopG/Arc/MetJ family transcriptional regulator